MQRFPGKLFVSLMALVIASVPCRASDTTRVFFIGNSFTYYNNMPDMVAGLASAAGEPMIYGQHTPGGVSVGDISQDTLAHSMNPTVFSTLRQSNWDYTVLQDNQGRFISSYGTFPDTTVSRVVAGHKKIADSMHYYNGCGHMLLFAGWGPKSGYLPYSPTGIGLIDSIYDNYHFLNNDMHEVISPIGIAWQRSMTECPTADLWGPDSTHPSAEGSYLTAAVIFCGIFRISPVELNYTAGLDSATARQLRTIAWQTVTDSVATTNLTSITVTVTFDGITYHASGSYSSWQWYRNDTAVADSTGSSFTPGQSGFYSVHGTDSAGCLFRSFPMYFELPAIVANNKAIHAPAFYPNPAQNCIYVRASSEWTTMAIRDLTGRCVMTSDLHTGENTISIDRALLTPGTYFISFSGASGTRNETLQIAY